MFVVWVDMLRIWPTKETCWTLLIQMMMMMKHKCEDLEDMPV